MLVSSSTTRIAAGRSPGALDASRVAPGKAPCCSLGRVIVTRMPQVETARKDERRAGPLQTAMPRIQGYPGVPSPRYGSRGVGGARESERGTVVTRENPAAERPTTPQHER